MTERIEELFNNKLGKAAYKTVISTIEKEGMAEKIKNGVLIGLSGGADSVFLLSFFYMYRKLNPETRLLAVHINHMIRGDEAQRDLDFSRELSEKLGIEFLWRKINVPEIAKSNRRGIEETARNERYNAFSDIISGRNDISCIAVAHNSTDNVETVLFNMLRGSGTLGLAGIAPVRDNIIRPLIKISKSQIEALLEEYGIPYVVDSTNLKTDYTRNYIRHEIVPKLRKVANDPEDIIGRLSDILRQNAVYFDCEAQRILSENTENGRVPLRVLRELHPALLREVLKKLLSLKGVTFENTHITKLSELIGKDSFSYDVPCGHTFVGKDGFCYVTEKGRGEESDEEFSFLFPLKLGINEFPEINGAIIVSEEKLTDSYSKVYKIAIQEKFPFDIINNGLTVRSKSDGDSYRYSNMSHKLKKMFIDRKIPLKMRSLVPVICDNEGIVWPIGFSKRDGLTKSEKNVYIALAFNNFSKANKSFYFKQNIISKKKGS